MRTESLALALLRRLDPERAHDLTLRALRAGFGPAQQEADDLVLRCRVFGLDFANPIGLAAGFDKDAEAFAAMLRLGMGFAEIGTVTPRPQAGNPKPRIFRLPEDGAVINRLGFNNRGIAAAALRLSTRGPGIVGANIGKNKDSADEVADYLTGARLLAPLADYLVVNVSSPNTPGLRALQRRAVLGDLVTRVRQAVAEARPDGPPPVLVKIAPDLTEEEKADIAAVALETGLSGLIVSNTTVARPADLAGRHRGEAGGLSGRPLFGPSTRLLAEMYRRTEGRLPLIGVGGVASGDDAYAKIRAGASLVQLYTALAYHGPALIPRIKADLAARLKADGFGSVAAAVGADCRRCGVGQAPALAPRPTGA